MDKSNRFWYSLIDGVTFQDMSGSEAIGRIPDGFGAVVQIIPTLGNPNAELVTTKVDQYDEPVYFTIFPNPVIGKLFMGRSSYHLAG